MSETQNLINWEVAVFFERARIREAWERLKNKSWYISAVDYIANDYMKSAMQKYPVSQKEQKIAEDLFPRESIKETASKYVRRAVYERVTMTGAKEMKKIIKEAQQLLNQKDFILSKLNEFLELEKAIMEIL